MTDDSSGLEDLILRLAREGRMRTNDGRALLMYPEEDVDPRDDADLIRTHIACGRCGAFVELRHCRPIAEVEINPCPLCGSPDWRQADDGRGIRADGCIAAPRSEDFERLPKVAYGIGPDIVQK